MDRITVSLRATRATFGMCSLSMSPGSEVRIAFVGPPFGCPGFGSHVSMWLGPPFIQRRIIALAFAVLFASARAARSSIATKKALAPSWMKFRLFMGLVVQDELGRVEEGPHEILEGGGLRIARLAHAAERTGPLAVHDLG